MKPTKTDKPLDAQQPPSSSDDVLTNLAALADEERAFAQRKAALRTVAFDELIAELNTLVLRMTNAGFLRPSIGKAMGFSTPKTGTAPSQSNKPSGPTSHLGWFNLFRSRSIQSYLRTHPDLAARLKADSIKSADYHAHIPSNDLLSIETAARASAQQRCPSTPPSVS